MRQNRNSKAEHNKDAGLTALEMVIGATLTGFMLLGAVGVQSASVASLKRNEIAAAPLDDLQRVELILDRELRNSKEFYGEPVDSSTPEPIDDGVTYDSIEYERVFFEGGSESDDAGTSEDTDPNTIALSGTNLVLTRPDGTSTTLASNVTLFTVVCTSVGANRRLDITLRIQRTPIGEDPISKTIVKTIFLRNIGTS